MCVFYLVVSFTDEFFFSISVVVFNAINWYSGEQCILPLVFRQTHKGNLINLLISHPVGGHLLQLDVIVPQIDSFLLVC